MTCPDLHDLRVLVVDDDPDARELLSVMLEQCGATVSSASSTAEGQAPLQTGRHDLLIADIGMPGQDGYDLIRAVRGQSPARGGRVPAIAVTAYAGDKNQEEALAAGYDAHVPKPVEADRLYSVIVNLLSRTAASGFAERIARSQGSSEGGLTVPRIAPILGTSTVRGRPRAPTTERLVLGAIFAASAAAVAFLLWLLYVHDPPPALAQQWVFLPQLNALLNGLSAVALCVGLYSSSTRIGELIERACSWRLASRPCSWSAMS
jgi:CheY-like chemotaxis protein